MNKHPNKILIVDDESEFRLMVSYLLKDHNYKVLNAEDCDTAEEKIKKESPDLILLDVKLPDNNGIRCLKEKESLISNIPIIMMAGHPDTHDAVEAIKEGAYDYITKPFNNEELISKIKQALQESHITKTYNRYRISEKDKKNLHEIMGSSKCITKVIEQIELVAKTDFSVLVEGESGVGKEVVAKYVHRYSDRSSESWMAVNCGAIPETLFESEFFGHIKGAYTGAKETKKGYFKKANNGTLFLDEIYSLTLPMQVKLLRVLQEQKLQKVGDSKTINLDVRIIGSSSDPLLDKINKNEFSRALYYRINQFKIKVPPLRKRKDDIIYLSNRFAKETSIELGKKFEGFSKKAKELLIHYQWPGNVRELKNVIRRVVLMAKGKVTYQILREELYQLDNYDNYDNLQSSIDHLIEEELTWKEFKKLKIKKFEKKLIRKMLHKTGGNISEAARQLQMNYKTLYNKIKKLDINKNDYKQ